MPKDAPGSRTLPDSADGWPPELYAVSVAIGPVTPATWPRCDRLLARLRAASSLPVTLLVAPPGDGTRTPTWYRDALTARVIDGDELAWFGDAHGQGTDGAAVNDASAREEAAAARFASGAVWFWSQGWRVSGFFPAHVALAEPAWGALTGGLLRYTVIGDELHLLGTTAYVAAPRARIGLASAIERLAGHPPGRIPAAAPLARVVLAPDDVERSRHLLRVQRLLAALCGSRWPITHAGFAACLARYLEDRDVPERTHYIRSP
jgi:predicted deacetylase